MSLSPEDTEHLDENDQTEKFSNSKSKNLHPEINTL